MKTQQTNARAPFTMTPKHRAAKIVRAPHETAGEAIEGFERGGRLVGMTKGQFSLLDLIQAIVRKTGPVHLTVSTWTTGVRDAENAALMIERGSLLSLRLLCDRSFPRRQPAYCRQILATFGADAIRCTNTHAKFALLRNDSWAVVIRSSMNLNRNPRFEQFDVDDDLEIADFFEAHIAEMEVLMLPGFAVSTREVDQAFAGALGGGLSDAYREGEVQEEFTPASAMAAAERACREALDG